jgi:5-(aminomethyl)-3-furanmethanol phosphate kinase
MEPDRFHEFEVVRENHRRAVLMWVVKVSGSLNRDPLLPLWLELMAQLGGGRVTIVCGGGSFAEEARHAHAHWRFDNSLHAHNMAVLAMAQAGYLALCLEPRLRLAASEASIRQILRAGHTAVWLPLELLRDRPGADTSGGVASDRIALELAGRLNAEHLVLVKSGDIKSAANVSELSRDGILHRCFESVAKRAGFPIDVVHISDLARMRSLLHGDIKPITA